MLNGLQKIADGRDFITTKEIAKYFSIAGQTVRKNYCEQKSLYGIKPLKIGNNLLWKITDIENLVNKEIVNDSI